MDFLSVLIILFCLFDGGWHRVGLYFDVLLYLIFLVLDGFAFEVMSRHVDELVFEELAISEGAELLTQLKILWITVLLALALEVIVFSLWKFGSQVVFSLENGHCLGSVDASLLTSLRHHILGEIFRGRCLFLARPPRVWLTLSLLLLLWFFSNQLFVGLLRLHWYLLCLDELSLFEVLFSTFGGLFWLFDFGKFGQFLFLMRYLFAAQWIYAGIR